LLEVNDNLCVIKLTSPPAQEVEELERVVRCPGGRFQRWVWCSDTFSIMRFLGLRWSVTIRRSKFVRSVHFDVLEAMERWQTRSVLLGAAVIRPER